MFIGGLDDFVVFICFSFHSTVLCNLLIYCVVFIKNSSLSCVNVLPGIRHLKVEFRCQIATVVRRLFDLEDRLNLLYATYCKTWKVVH